MSSNTKKLLTEFLPNAESAEPVETTSAMAPLRQGPRLITRLGGNKKKKRPGICLTACMRETLIDPAGGVGV